MTVTIPTWLLAALLAVSAAVGYASCYFGVVKIGMALQKARRRNQEDADMTNRRTPWTPIIMLVASAMVVTLGALYLLDGHNQKQLAKERAEDQAGYDQCITEWGDDLVLGINAAKATRKSYDEAQAAYTTAANARDDATAVVLRAALGLSVKPSTSTPADVIGALQEARRADDAVKAAKVTLDHEADKLGQQTQSYVPPTLACASERTDP